MIKENKIVLLTGLKRSGKDEAAKALLNTKEYKRYAFADPIKVACKEVFLLDDEQVDGCKKEVVDERWGMSPRKIFQLFGTELMRETLCELDDGYKDSVGEDLWIKRFMECYKENPNNYVITDFRFPNEAKMIKENFDNVVSVRVERDSVVDNDLHASENQIMGLDVDYVIHNNGTIEELHKKICEIIKERGEIIK
jgi:dephospho-CoA kinase